MGLMNSLKSAFRPRTRRDIETDYLNEATSRADLELREREIDRGRFRHGQRR